MRELLLNAFTSTIFKSISALLKFVQILLITNLFGAENYGAYTFAISVFLLINSVFRFGFDVYIHKTVASILLNQNILKAQSFFAKTSLIPIIFLIIVSLLIIIYFEFTNEISLKFSFFKSLIIYSSAYAFMWLFAYYNRGIEKGKTSVFILEIIFPIINIISIVVLNLLEFDVVYILIHSFGFAIIVCMLIFFSLERIKLNLFFDKIKIFKNYYKKEIFNAFPFLLISMSSMLLAWVDFYVISFFEEDRELGIYAVSTRLSLFMLFPASAVAIFFSNKLVDFFKNNNMTELKSFFKTITLVLTIVSIILFVTINLFSPQILSLFGKEFIDGSEVLLILTFAYMISASAGAFETVILMSSFKSDLFKMNLITVFSNIIFNIPLVINFGIEGAAFGTLLSITLLRIMQHRIIYNRVLIS